MIKFNSLIHKETGTVIKYQDWKRDLEKVNLVIINGYDAYEPDEIIFSDDFEIIYDSEFTLDELYRLYGLSGDLAPKIAKIIEQRRNLTKEYRIEV